MLMAPLKWGICATGLIAHEFATAIRIKPENHEISVVAGRTQQKVDEFAQKFQVPRKLYSCEELATCDGIDIIYIASLTNLHYKHAKLFLEAGKNVLCEKPLTLSAEQTRELLALAKSKSCFLMVALWSRFFPLYKRLREAIDADEIGEVRALNASFCLPGASDVERLHDISKGGGILADFGVYLVNIACWVFKSERPISISAVGNLFQSGADRSGSLTLRFANNRLAVLCYSCDCGPYAKAFIMGDKGVAELGDLMWCPTKLKIKDQEYHEPTPEGKWTFFESGGLLYEADHVKDCLEKGLLESPLLTHSDCQLIHDILDEGYRQIGVHYPLK